MNFIGVFFRDASILLLRGTLLVALSNCNRDVNGKRSNSLVPEPSINVSTRSSDVDEREAHKKRIQDQCEPDRPEWRVREIAVLEKVNAVRKRGVRCGKKFYQATTPLREEPALYCAASRHSRDMAARGFFSHTNPDGEQPSDRARFMGFHSSVSENLAWGQKDPDEVIRLWLSRPGHCATLMNPKFGVTGVGYSEGTSKKPFWTQLFGELSIGR